MKYKRSDRVIVCGNQARHGYEIGEIITIAEVESNDYLCSNSFNKCWFVDEEDIKPYIKELPLRIEVI
jgi:hypothetical protein